MTAPDPARKLASLLRRLRADYGPTERETWAEDQAPGGDPLIAQLIFSFLAWEASTHKAAAALKRIMAAVVDYNELRVCLPDELARVMGERYPRAVERASRLRASLNDLYRREHCVTLAPLAAMAKRDARGYLASLEGMPRFVADRVTLLAFEGHVFPIDERIAAGLLEEEALAGELGLDEASSWLERQFRAGEAAPAYLLLEAWMNDRPPPRVAKRPAPPAPVIAPKAEPPRPDPARKPAKEPPRPAPARKPQPPGEARKTTKP